MLSKTEWVSQPQTLVQRNDMATPADSTLDSHFFASALMNDSGPKPPAPAISAHYLAEQSTALKSKSDLVSRGLKDFASGKHSLKAAQVPLALVESKELLSVSVKVIKHGIAMVEKTTNLQ